MSETDPMLTECEKEGTDHLQNYSKRRYQDPMGILRLWFQVVHDARCIGQDDAEHPF